MIVRVRRAKSDFLNIYEMVKKRIQFIAEMIKHIVIPILGSFDDFERAENSLCSK